MTRYERMKMQRRMQRRIRLVVEERRMALALRTDRRRESRPSIRRPPWRYPGPAAEPA